MSDDECEYCDDPLCIGTCQPQPGTLVVLIGVVGIAVILTILVAKLVI
ncbi:MAG: hypothetical protein RLZZ343_853 [Actinomycetota bacterium]